MHDLPLVSTIAAAFFVAWLLGLLTQRLRLSPIVGYLLAGIVIGPYSPGFVGDAQIAHELAEIGVILLMFGVGLHFDLKDLLSVKTVAITGALGQSVVATALGVALFGALGLPLQSGLVLGIAMAVASTVVLVRMLEGARLIETPEGHVAVGWLVVEDLLTVIVLVLIPTLANVTAPGNAGASAMDVLASIGIVLLKLVLLVALAMVGGKRAIPWVLTRVARLRSRELFTLTVLVFSIALAAGAYVVFGASMALGAFLAGMIVAQSPLSHQVAAEALTLRDAFAVVFFVSVGMVFDPSSVIEHPARLLVALGVVLIAKPVAALSIVTLLGHSSKTALTVAVGLAQIGEFSFILSDAAQKHGLLAEQGHNALVGASIISITLNPLLFAALPSFEVWIRRRPRLWNLLNRKARSAESSGGVTPAQDTANGTTSSVQLAVIVGYGPVGQSVDRLLREGGMETVIIDFNLETVLALHHDKRRAVYGDASRTHILEEAGIARASHLILTLPHESDREAVVSAARSLNSSVRMFVRARYLSERVALEQAGATAAVFEEAEAAVALARLVLLDSGASRDLVERTIRDLRLRLVLDNVPDV